MSKRPNKAFVPIFNSKKKQRQAVIAHPNEPPPPQPTQQPPNFRNRRLGDDDSNQQQRMNPPWFFSSSSNFKNQMAGPQFNWPHNQSGFDSDDLVLDPADPPLPFTSAQSHYHMGGASSSYGYGGSSASKSAGPHTHASRYSSRMPYEDDIKEEEPGFQRSEMCISSYEPQQSAMTMKRGGPSGSYPGNLPKRKERTMYQYMNSRSDGPPIESDAGSRKGLPTKEKEEDAFAPMSQGTQVHMVSSNVESLKFWKESSATVLIEIFGYVQGLIRDGEDGVSKIFTIRDQTGSLRCQYWEMDHPLPQLTPGKLYRCVGNLDKGLFLKCVHLRQARPGEKEAVGVRITRSIQAFKNDLTKEQ
ncbi:spermatogenesis-associated protein 22-like isoform X2 [Oscarella lobularis]|uniref:spermatogenesis-associated protein 22-like isoform X2 n=1 Tax=Oscarella lobularis TaxID=121494 RepID=UPI0033131441